MVSVDCVLTFSRAANHFRAADLHIQVFHIICSDQFCYISFLDIWKEIQLERENEKKKIRPFERQRK